MDTMSAINEIKSLLTNVLQGVGYIQLVRSFKDDLEVHQVRLKLIQLRLSRWAAAAGLAVGDNTTGQEIPAPLVKENTNLVEDLLKQLKTVLDKSQQDSKEFAPKEADHEQDPPADPDSDIGSSKVKQLKVRIQKIIQRRCAKSSDYLKGVKWILYKKEQCETLTTQLSGLIDQLEQYAPSDRLEKLSQEDSKDMSDSLETLLEIMGTVDPRLQQAANEKRDAEKRVQFSAETNNGLQMGINYGEFKGIAFGSGHTVNNNWG